MADYSKLSDAELLAMLQPQQVAPVQPSAAPSLLSPTPMSATPPLSSAGAPPLNAPANYSQMSDADLLKLVQPQAQPQAQPSITDAVTDIPAEIGRTASSNLSSVTDNLSNRGANTSPFGFLNTGKAILGAAGLAASPITGALRSLIGHPMAQAEHAVGTVINPKVAAHDDPQKMYETAAGDVETALSAGRPTGVGPVGALAPRPVQIAAPSVSELKASARAAYNHPDVAAVEIAPHSVSNLSTTIENDLAQQGFRPRGQSGVFDEVRALNPPQGVDSVRVADIDSARKALGVIAKERDAVGQPTPNAAAASIARDHINDYLPNLTQPDLIAGDASRASSILDQARSDWSAAKRSESVDLQLTRAERQAAKSGSGSNIENSMRQKIAALLDNPKRTVGYSDNERQTMENIVRGTPTRNVLRKVGKLGVDGGLSLLIHGGTALSTGGVNLPVAAAGTAARKIGEMLTAGQGRNLSEMIRNRSQLSTQNNAQAAIQQALMGGQAASPLAAFVQRAGLSSQDPRKAAIIQALMSGSNLNRHLDGR